MSTQATVQAAYDLTMAANAADPYEHHVYEAAEQVLIDANTAYYGHALADLAREMQLDSGEVFSREEVLRHHRDNALHGSNGMEHNAVLAVHSSSDDETRDHLRRVWELAQTLRDADPGIDLRALVTEVLAEGMRAAAADFGIEL